MELRKFKKNLKWQVSVIALIIFCFSMVPFPNVIAKAGTVTNSTVISADGTKVTFYYEDASATSVSLAGEMNGWSETATPMTKDGNGIWSTTINIDSSVNGYQYKFVVNGKDWIADPVNTVKSGDNSYLKLLLVTKASAPILNDDGTVTFSYKDTNSSSVCFAGNTNGWSETATPMTNSGYGVWSVTVNPGTTTGIEYKFVAGGSWVTDPLNTAAANGNSYFKIPTPADASAPYLDGNGGITISYKDANATKVCVAGEFNGWDKTANQMTKDADTGIWSVTVKPSTVKTGYEYKIVTYYGNDTPNWNMDPKNTEVKDSNSYVEYKDFSDAQAPYVNQDGSVVFSYKGASAAAVSVAGDLNGWTAGKNNLTKNSNGIWVLRYVPVEGTKTITYKYVVDGNWTCDPLNTNLVSDGYGSYNGVVNLTKTVTPSKKVIVKYTRPDKNYDGWTLYTWSTGKLDGDYDFKVVDGVGIAEVPIGDTTKSIGFKIRKDKQWVTVDYASDRYITIDTAADVTKATVTSGVGDIFVVPAIETAKIDNGKILFKYRNKDLYNESKQDTIDKVEVEVTSPSNQTTTNTMAYDSTNEYFAYDYSGITDGDYAYKIYETIGGTRSEVKSGTLTYKKRTIDATASVSPSTVNSDENAVVTLDLTGTDAKADSISGIYLDLSSVGGPSKVPMDVSLLSDGKIRQTIGVTDSTTAGTKTIPVTIVDVNGESHRTSVDITVKTKTSIDDPLGFSFDQAVIYQVVTDRYLNGNTSNDDPHGNNYDKTAAYTYHGGDFAGLTSKIGYLKDLGINTIWISPIVENTDTNQDKTLPGGQYSYHGYWAKDFTLLDPHFGTIQELKTLIDTAHKNGIKIMVDVVLNHSGYGTESLFGDMLRTTSGGDDYTTPSSNLPDFRTEDPVVRAQLIRWQSDWIEKLKTDSGNTIDYFRIDTVKHVENATWKEFKSTLTTINPKFKVIGEYYGADVNTDGGQLQTGQMDALLDFSYKSYAKSFVNGSLADTSKTLDARASKMNNNYLLGQFLSSHDEDGFLTSLDGNTDNAITDEDRAKDLVAASLQITDKGMPVIYYGEELGMSAKNSFEAGDPNRYDMNFSLKDTATGSKTYNHYKKLISIRNKYSLVFAKGDRKTLVADDTEGYTVFSRSYGDTTVLTALNIKDAAKEVTLRIPSKAGKNITDLYSGTEYTVGEDGSVKVNVPASSSGGTAIFAYKVEPTTDNTTTNTSTTTTTSNDTTPVVVSTNGIVNKETLLAIKNSGKNEVPVIQVGTTQFTIKNIDGLLAKMEASGVSQLEITVTGKIKNQKALAKVSDNLIGQFKFDCNLLSGILGTDVEIKVPVDSKYNGKTLYMYYIDSDGQYIQVGDAKVVDGIYTFTTSHFSDYVLLDKKLDSSATSASNKTGDYNNNLAFVFASLFAASGIFIGMSRKKESNTEN